MPWPTQLFAIPAQVRAVVAVHSNRPNSNRQLADYKTEGTPSQGVILRELAHLMKAGLVPGLASVCEDTELQEVVAAWRALPATVRVVIMALIRASNAAGAD